MRRACDRFWEIDPYREGRLGPNAAKSFERHLRGCAECRNQADRDERLREIARRLPDPAPSDLALRRLQTRVLRDVALGAPTRAIRRLRLAFAVMAAALGCFAVWHHTESRLASHAVATVAGAAAGASPPKAEIGPGSAPSPDAPAPASELAGSVVASPNARWSQTRESGIERVQIEDGAVRVHVRRQVEGERFLVALPDGEIEVRGTTFDVIVEHGATTRVHVDEGLVELRIRGRGTTRLTAGEAWNVPAPPNGSASAFRVAAGPARAPVVAPRTETSVGDTPGADDVAAYTAAIQWMQQGQFDRAAAAFHALVLAEPRTLQAQDASFLEAVALARAGRTDAAALAAEQHLAAFPDSFHRKEAAILIARAASQRGDCPKARAIVSAWNDGSPDAEVRSAMGRCRDGTPR
ncbi:MAG: tetratricopeptide repeat protein [Polyangiaceae bacterium]|jgi:TolA-binding protein